MIVREQQVHDTEDGEAALTETKIGESDETTSEKDGTSVGKSTVYIEISKTLGLHVWRQHTCNDDCSQALLTA